MSNKDNHLKTIFLNKNLDIHLYLNRVEICEDDILTLSDDALTLYQLTKNSNQIKAYLFSQTDGWQYLNAYDIEYLK